ncbi:unnamed protein product [Rotaria magnacalcarata]|uniref:Uncharacterized protein n=1 Tax=Rotaria magnacalcarata TaxID=392030 RepID=A0A817A0P5_9BILA|nr:unnamed protein product [Rotaria magnacalcarata]
MYSIISCWNLIAWLSVKMLSHWFVYKTNENGKLHIKYKKDDINLLCTIFKEGDNMKIDVEKNGLRVDTISTNIKDYARKNGNIVHPTMLVAHFKLYIMPLINPQPAAQADASNNNTGDEDVDNSENH